MKSWISFVESFSVLQLPKFLKPLFEATQCSIELFQRLDLRPRKVHSSIQPSPDSWKISMASRICLQALVLFFAAFPSLISDWDISGQNDRHGCQAYSNDPLDGCDRERTIFVDVVSSDSKYKTVQSGIASSSTHLANWKNNSCGIITKQHW